MIAPPKCQNALPALMTESAVSKCSSFSISTSPLRSSLGCPREFITVLFSKSISKAPAFKDVFVFASHTNKILSTVLTSCNFQSTISPMTEGDDLKMKRGDFENALRRILSAPNHPKSKKSKAKKAKKQPKRSKG